MAPSLDKFTWKTAKKSPEKLGELRDDELPPGELIATREFLIQERLNRDTRRRGSPDWAEVVEVDGEYYLVDGHHKSAHALKEGRPIPARVLKTDDPRVTQKLRLSGHGKLSDLEVK